MCPYILCPYANSYESYVHVSWHAECSNYVLKFGQQQVCPSNCNALPVDSAIIQYVLSIIMAAVIFFIVGLGFKRIETQAYKHRVYMLQLSTSTYMECSAVC